MIISTFMLVGYNGCLYLSSAETSVTDHVVPSVYKHPVIEVYHGVVHEYTFLGH